MYEQLLKDNRGLIAWAAGKYLRAVQRDAAIDYADLLQIAFIGLVEASRTFDASKGDSWSHWALQYINRELQQAIGWRDGKWTKAHSGAVALDAPIDDESGDTRLDLLPDDGPPIDAGVLLEGDRQVVRDCVAALEDDRQRAVVERWQLGEETQADVAATLGVSAQMVSVIWKRARKVLARDQRLRALVDLELRTPYYAHVGVNRFNTTHTSAVEKAVLWRIDHDSGGQAPPTPLPFEASPEGEKRGKFLEKEGIAP